MYHQYMYGSFSPVTHDPKPSACPPQGERKAPVRQKDPLSSLTGGLSGLLGKLGTQDLFARFDTGDILLILIILFLFLEGDNLELVITLGLMLLLDPEDPHSPS